MSNIFQKILIIILFIFIINCGFSQDNQRIDTLNLKVINLEEDTHNNCVYITAKNYNKKVVIISPNPKETFIGEKIHRYKKYKFIISYINSKPIVLGSPMILKIQDETYVIPEKITWKGECVTSLNVTGNNYLPIEKMSTSPSDKSTK